MISRSMRRERRHQLRRIEPDIGWRHAEFDRRGILPAVPRNPGHLFSQDGAPITPATAPVDGLSPRTFYTYQIVFVPDLTQKYGLQIKGGAGEIRAAMNLVNGWQFTGLGPYYMKDSSTAQDILSAGISTRLGGQAVADVLKGVADLTGGAGRKAAE